MRYILVLILASISFFGVHSEAGELKPYSSGNGSVLTARTASGVAVSEPATGAVIQTGGAIKATWTVTTDPSTYDRVVVLVGNTTRPGVFYQVPFTDGLPKGGGSVSAPLSDALYDELVSIFVHVDQMPDLDAATAAKVPASFIIEVRGEVTDSHTVTGNPQYAACIGDSGVFAIQKTPPPPAPTIANAALGSTVSTLTVWQEGTVTGSFTVAPSNIVPTAQVNWGDGATTGAQIVQGTGAGNWLFNASHVWTSPGTFSATVTISAGGATAALPFTVTVAAIPPVTITLPLNNVIGADLTALKQAGWTVKPSGGNGFGKPGKVIATSPDGSQSITFSSRPVKIKK